MADPRQKVTQLPAVKKRKPTPMPEIKRRTPPIAGGGANKQRQLYDSRQAGGLRAPGGKGFSTFLSKMGQNANFKGSGDSRSSYEPNQQVRDFQPYGAGKPKYGGGRSMPNVGPVSGREGYRERDLKARVMKQRQMKLLKSRGKTGATKPDRTF